MHIFQVIAGYEGGGVLRVLEMLAEHLPEMRWLALQAGKATQELSRRGIAVNIIGHPLRVQSAGSNTIMALGSYARLLPDLWRAARGVCDHLPHDEPCLLHCHSLPMVLICSLVAIERKGVDTRIVYHFHSTMNPQRLWGLLPKFQRRVLVRYCTRIVAVSHAVAEYWRGSKVPVSVLYNGVGEWPRPSAPPFDLRLFQPQTRHLLVAGTLIPDKGHAVALEALYIVSRESDVPVHLWVAGAPTGETSSYARYLVERARVLGLEQDITFLGHVPNIRDWHPYMFIGLQMRISPEPCSMWVLETMYDGLPLVASTTGGTPELVRHEKEALLVKPNDPEMTAGAILRLMSDRSLYSRLQENCLMRARSKFSTAHWLENLLAIYAQVLA